MSQSVTMSRVKDQRQGSEIVILLEVSIESLTLKTCADGRNRSTCVETVMKFYEAVKNDRDHVLSDLKKLLIADYDLKALRPISKPGTEGSLILEVLLPRTRLVSIQCDHSSGRLHKQLQKTLVTEKLLKDLSVNDITLTFEPKSA